MCEQPDDAPVAFEVPGSFPEPGVPTMDLLETCAGPGGPPICWRWRGLWPRRVR